MEKLRVKNLGPIKDFEMETNRLTVLIGPQASGKSLMAQLLYYVDDIQSLAAENHYDRMAEDAWLELVTTGLLSQIRGAAIQYFSWNNSGQISYTNSIGQVFEASVRDKICPDNAAISTLINWRNEWINNKNELTRAQFSKSIFIPSERMMFSEFRERKESILYDPVQTPQMRRFCSRIESSKLLYMRSSGLWDNGQGILLDRFTALQKEALRGVVRYTNGMWSWHVDGAGVIPLGGLSSGQMAAWPFFLLSSVVNSTKLIHNFFFEEPELHLHPNAQKNIVEAIALLVESGNNVVITTHSPFILYVINNLIQAHIAYDGKPPEGEFSIDPDHVAAYCMGEKPHSIVDKETKLLDLDEIDDVFDDIGEYFQTMLDVAYAKRKKKK